MSAASGAQFDNWQHTNRIIDGVPRRGGVSLLENPKGVRYLTRGELCTQAELTRLTPIERCT